MRPRHVPSQHIHVARPSHTEGDMASELAFLALAVIAVVSVLLRWLT